MYKNTNIYKTLQIKFQDKLSSLLKTAENLKVKGLAEVIILTMIMIVMMVLITITMIIVTIIMILVTIIIIMIMIFMIIITMTIMIVAMIMMIIMMLQVSGEEGKGGQASATPRLPGVSPIVPRIQQGQPPPMQVMNHLKVLEMYFWDDGSFPNRPQNTRQVEDYQND